MRRSSTVTLDSCPLMVMLFEFKCCRQCVWSVANHSSQEGQCMDDDFPPVHRLEPVREPSALHVRLASFLPCSICISYSVGTCSTADLVRMCRVSCGYMLVLQLFSQGEGCCWMLLVNLCVPGRTYDHALSYSKLDLCICLLSLVHRWTLRFCLVAPFTHLVRGNFTVGNFTVGNFTVGNGRSSMCKPPANSQQAVK